MPPNSIAPVRWLTFLMNLKEGLTIVVVLLTIISAILSFLISLL